MMLSLGSKFDWYEATIDGVDDDRVAPAFALALGGTLARGKARNGYATCWVVERDEAVLAQVYGRSARLGEVHITITSEACIEVVPLLRRLYPEHRVSRADSAVDLEADFDQLDAVMLAFADERALSHRLITSSDGGATRYVGSPSSEVRMRVYKKSEQLLAMHPEKASDIPAGVVRFEVQVRPGKRIFKERMSTLDSDGVWGSSKWSGELGRMVLGIESERISTHFRRPTDFARAMHYVGVQYGPIMRKRAEVVGIDQARAELFEALGL